MITTRRLATLMLGIVLTACGDDSTGPAAIDLRLAASSFDALGRSRIDVGDGSGATASRHAALALRAGIRPTRVSITVDGTTEQYWALAVEHAFGDDVSEAPVLTLPIVTRSMVAWRGARPERVISITVAGDTSTFSWSRSSTTELPPDRPYFIHPSIGILFERGGPPFFAIDGGARSTRQSIGAACQVPARPAMMPTAAPEIPLKSCHRAVFFARFNMRVQEAPIGGAAAIRVRVVEMGAHDIAGIRLEWDPLCITC